MVCLDCFGSSPLASGIGVAPPHSILNSLDGFKRALSPAADSVLERRAKCRIWARPRGPKTWVGATVFYQCLSFSVEGASLNQYATKERLFSMAARGLKQFEGKERDNPLQTRVPEGTGVSMAGLW